MSGAHVDGMGAGAVTGDLAVPSARRSVARDVATPDARAPLVSVILPTYNRAHVIGRALRSVLEQDFTDFEVLVVDDASTDDTERVVRAFGDPRIRYLREPRNGGPNAARNRGLREARGEFIAFLDSDDEWLPGKLSRQVARFRELPETVGAVYTGVETLTPRGERKWFVPRRRGDLYPALLAHNVLHGASQSIMIRRSVTERVGGFDVRYPAIGDYDYWVRVSACCEIDHVAEPLARYHDTVSEARVSRSYANNLRGRELFYEKHRAEMKRLGVAHRFLTESARRHLKRAHWDPVQARELLREALAEQPRDVHAWLLLAKSWIPTPLFRLWVSATRWLWGE